MAVKAVPEGFHTLTTVVTAQDAAGAIEWLKKALGAREITRAPDPSGKKIWHADLMIGDSHLFVSDVFPEMGAKDPRPGSLWVYTPDVDAAFQRAVDAGAKVTMPLADQFWGDRMGKLVDRWGNDWTLAQHVRDMTPEEMQKAQDEMLRKMRGGK